MPNRKLLISFWILFYCMSSFAQLKKEDSLVNIISSTKVDSIKFNAFKALYSHYSFTSQILKKESVALQLIELGKKVNNDYYKGIGYRFLAEHYHSIDENTKAFENFLIAIGYLEKTNKYSSLVSAYTNFAGVYYSLGDIKKAALNFKKALSILKKNNINDVAALTNINNNLGICAAIEKNKDLAKFYFQNSIAIWFKCGDSASLGAGYNNLAYLAVDFGQLDTAEYYYKKALGYKLKYGSKDDALDGYNSLGTLYMRKKNNKQALEYLLMAEKLIDTINTGETNLNLIDNLAETYSNMGQYKQANEYQRKHLKIVLKKFNDKQSTDINKAEKAYADSISFMNEKQIKELEIANQNAQLEADRQQKIFLIVGLILVMIGGGLFYNRYKITKKQKEIIEGQKLLVEEQKKEIVDSINYANKIQNAVLTNESVWKSISEQHFIFFKPKDIVSGDFYWAYETPKEQYIWAVADCTGHGVPGAFMSMLGNSLLNQIVIESKNYKPEDILNKLREKIILALTNENSEHSDGMDMALCVLDKKKYTLEFAGANNGAIIIRDNNIIECKGEKMPIGKHHGELKPFTSRKIDLKKNDQVYLYTDGFADQFGGPRGKKFRYKQLDELILANQHHEMKVQRQLLEQSFLTWKGQLVQTDDICIVGIKVC